MTTAPPPKLRADAQRNRDQIVRAATAAFADESMEVPMEDVARLAGVGVGTLYRRFPDRSALILAVIQDSLQAVLAKVRTMVSEEPRAWDALVRSMDHSPELNLALRLTNSVSAEAEVQFAADPVIEQIRVELMDIIDTMVQAAQREGSLRDDVGTGDIVYLFFMLDRAATGISGALAASSFERARSVVLDGLRTGGSTALPGSPPPLDQKLHTGRN